MKGLLKNDKVIIVTLSLIAIILSIFCFQLLFLTNLQKPQIENTSVFATRCGFVKDSSFEFVNGNLIHDRMFSFPYYAIEIKADDYFSLKRERQYLIDDHKNSNTENIQQYFDKVIVARNQTISYPKILREFQKIKKIYDLNDDQYLEIIVRFVQSMPYFTENKDVKYPLITFADGCGDCDDKSLLLVALLSQENYNVSIFIIPPDGFNHFSHAMAGVASNSATFTKKGYAMIETTKKDSTIGDFPPNVASEKVSVIRIGNGAKTYETHSSVWIFDSSTMFKVIKNGNKTLSITPYHHDIGIMGIFKKGEENFDWKNDCTSHGSIPPLICRLESNEFT